MSRFLLLVLSNYVQRFGYQRGDFSMAESLGDVLLALPFCSIMIEEQVDYVCEHLRAAVGALS